MGEAFLGICPFRPLVERSSCSTFIKIWESLPVLFPLRAGLRAAFPCFILRAQIGNNSGTDMLAQYGDFGTS